MEEAVVVFSPEFGFFKQTIKATDITSYAQARKISPFIDNSNDKKLVYWVGWGAKKKNGSHRVAHFKHFKNKNLLKSIQIDIKEYQKIKKNDLRHSKAQQILFDFLNERMKFNKCIPWKYKDTDVSDFTISGDLLADVASIEKEYVYKTNLGFNYIFDIAIIGKKVNKEPIILAVIELEFTHKYDFMKSIVCKSLGFPLMSINLEDYPESDIDLKWAHSALMETKYTSGDSFRRNFINISRMLLPLYIDIPREFVDKSRHQYVIFSKDSELFATWLRKYKKILKISDRELMINHVKAVNHETNTELYNAGVLVGEQWVDYNCSDYIKISLEKPIGKSGDIYIFHLILARLSSTYSDCLVGYKFQPGETHYVGDSLFWETTDRNTKRKLRIAPKRLSEQTLSVIDMLKQLEITK